MVKKMASDPYFNMNDEKWDDMIAEAVEHGHLKDTREYEAILEDMLNRDKLPPGRSPSKLLSLRFKNFNGLSAPRDLKMLLFNSLKARFNFSNLFKWTNFIKPA